MNLASETKYKPLIKLSLRSLLLFYSKSSIQNDNDFLDYLNLYRKNCSDTEDWIYYFSYKFNLSSQTKLYNEKENQLQNESNRLFLKYDSIFNFYNKGKLSSIYYFDKANNIIRQNPLKAKFYYQKSIDDIDSSNFFRANKFRVLLNFARVASLTENFQNGINFLHRSSKYININDSLRYLYNQKAFLADMHSKVKNYDSAYFYARQVRFLGYKRNFQQHSTIISKTKVQIETIEKEQENSELRAKREQDKLILFIGGAFFILAAFIVFLSLKNSKKKRLLAEQQKELEKQKNLTLLKEQEINTINAMVTGQEKERVRIAEDLHDNIGSVLATLKLHFENLKINREKKHFNQDELYEKTEKLIDETYLKVRNIAHAKNAGVIANQGLLVAVKIMAEKISAANQLKIDIIDFGLEQRLDTNTEITLFRIIQELTTNIIKHAEAKEATINISQFDDTINIIIEDNGKGFDPKTTTTKSGMGLHSIQKRIEHLNGTFQIDSSSKSGTSIIINIPL